MITLGLSGGFGHDATACVVRDGALLAVVEEERVSRFKGAYGQPPIQATLKALHEARVDPEDVDTIAFGWDPTLDPDLVQLSATRDAVLGAPALRCLRPRSIRYLDHHLCHATTALAAAGWSDTAVVVLDGRGERASTSVYRSADGCLELVADFDVVDSIGSFYSAASRFAGFARGGEGTFMGLAGYGSPCVIAPFAMDGAGFRAAIRMPRDGARTTRHAAVRSLWFDFFERAFGPARVSHAEEKDRFLDFSRWANFAASIQDALNTVVAHICDWSLRITGCDSLALSGGVALNCTTNGTLRARYGPKLTLYGCMGDAGTAIGAALQADESAAGRAWLTHAYLGVSQSDEDVRSTLSGFGLEWQEPDDLAATVADLICEGRIVGWWQGRAEIGPRALGHRSIVAQANSPHLARRVNRLKGRESWRPLAPSVAASDARPLFGVDRSHFMLEAVRATDLALKEVAACVHVDGTSRLHTPGDATGGRFTSLLNAVGQRSGVAACLNTSFNIGPEPIVNTVADAVRTYFASELDALVVGPALMLKGTLR